MHDGRGAVADYRESPDGRSRHRRHHSHQQESDSRERVAEAYYRFVLADWLSVVANVQWVLSGPNQVTGGENHHLIVPGLRALLQF